MGPCKKLNIALCIYLIIDIFRTRNQKFTNKFKDINIKVAHKTTKTTQKNIQSKQHNNNEHENSDVHRIKYMDCPL
jgi:hypothetical protein